MASSRTSFALSRDHKFPGIFKVINTSTKTPIVSILVTGLIVLISVTIRDLKHISNVTSILALTGHSLVNVALIIFRQKEPNAERKFKVLLYPLTPTLGIVLNAFLVLQLAYSDFIALLVPFGIILSGLLYYYIGIPKLQKAPKGISSLDIPVLDIDADELDNEARKVFIPVSNPETIDTLLFFGQKIAERENNTTVIPIYVTNVPSFTPMDSANKELKERINSHDIILDKLNKYEMKNKSFVKSLVVFSRDISHGILSSIEEGKASLMIMGWHASRLAHNVHGSIVPKLLQKVPSDIGILKSNNLKEVKKILFPYGGGKYSQLTAPIVKRIADAFDAEITVMRIVDELYNEDELKE